MSTFYPVGGGTYNLNSSISSTDTTITLSSFTEPVSGVAYTMALLNTSIAYGTIAPRTTSSEFISFTGITQNSDGTATLTGVTRGLAKKYPFTSSSTFKLPHSGQSIFILSDAPQVFQKFASVDNDITINGLWTFAQTPIGLNPGAVQDASTTVKGIGKLSVTPVSSTNPIFVGDNDPRVPTTAQVGYIPTSGQKDALTGTSGTPSSSNKYVTNDDTASAATASKLARRNSTGDVTVNSTPTASTDAASKSYVDAYTSKITIATSSVVVSGTTTETTLVSATVPSGTLGTANGVLCRLNFSVISSSDNISHNVEFFLKYGATTLFDELLIGNFFANNSSGYIEFFLAASGATNTQIGSMTKLFFGGDGSNQTTYFTQSKATSAEDSTANKTIAITVKNNVTNLSVTMTDARITIIK